MSIIRELPPTAGLPFTAKDLLPILCCRDSKALEEDFKEYLGIDYAHIACSGTAAFYIILGALKKLSGKRRVIIPSFVCPLLPLAIERSGLKATACDIAKSSFDFEINELKSLCLKNKDILAIIPAHLGGIPVNLEPIKEISADNGIFIVEDCAQSLGATYQGRKSGTIGDFSFFSLCRGKGVTIYEGGAITCRREFSGLIEETAKDMEKEDWLSECLRLIELFGYWLFYRPHLFWFAFKLPQLFWQLQNKPEKAAIEYFSPGFPVHKVSERRKAVGHMQWRRLEKEISSQREKARYYMEGLKNAGGIRILSGLAGDCPNYPYLTLIFDDESRRAAALKSLEGAGLGVSRIYLWPITGYRYLKNLYSPLASPNAKYLAQRHITLTTSSFLKKTDQDYIINKLKGIK